MNHPDEVIAPSSLVGRYSYGCQGEPGKRGAGSRVSFVLTLLGSLIWIFLIHPHESKAAFFDTFGMSARGMALGNAMAAMAEGWESVYYNPAGLALGREIEVSLGLLAAFPKLKVQYAQGNEQTERKFSLSSAPLDTITGPLFGLLLPIQKCTPRKLPMPWALGVGLFVPRQALVTSRVMEEGFPFDVTFNERNSTLALYSGLSTRITPALYLGVGIAAQLVTPAELQLSYTGTQTATDLEARFGRPSILLGLLIRPTERIRIGIVYREEMKVVSEWNARIKTRFVLVPGTDIALYDEQLLSRRYVTGFAPEAVTVGASYKVIERLRLSGELTWYRWSHYGGPLDTGLEYEFNDLVVPRLGMSYRLTRQIDLRCGFYYEPTPVTNQAQGFYPIGNDRYVSSAGIGYTFTAPWGILAKPVSVDGYIQYHLLKGEAFDRAASPNPVTRDPDLSSTGYVLNMGFNVTLRF